LLLRGIRIDSVTVSKCQHSSSLLYLLENSTTLNVKRPGVEPPLLTAFHPTTKLSGVLATLDVCPSSYSGGLPGELDKQAARTIAAPACKRCRFFIIDHSVAD
jgi:hypothetical protein